MKFAVAALLSLSLTVAVSAAADEIDVRTFEVILSHEDTERDTVGALKFRGGLDIRSSSASNSATGCNVSPRQMRRHHVRLMQDNGRSISMEEIYPRYKTPTVS